ncbi:MAG: hypothetical protein AVDCRST_MAG36-676 [uncultured Nocardioidaceae bacterium]|uniref:Uncharacterized protein n=1 Tax=uncultured Nocardioidaceae bacterium TaxID=253824 RepID=A0A6J4L7J4_9ACTN|nr:MAG: hypothetical protein AVDCRST_MAG36-676 [uncultured Nocardioidaceae bacterium]
MSRYADPRRCPDCAAAITTDDQSCPSCSLPLRGPLAGELYVTLAHADQVLTELRASVQASVQASEQASVQASAPLPAPALVPYATTKTPGTAPLRPRAPRSTGLSGASVPQLLLGLGALCLLVAALVFLAVTWSVMGVGGRTATLVVFTAVAGTVTALVARKGLRGATEALGLVTLGLVGLDVAGADNSGWFGDLATPSFLVVLGAVLAVSATAACLAVRATASRAFTGGEGVIGLAWFLVTLGVMDGSGSSAAGTLLATLLTAAGTAAAHRLGLLVATLVVAVVTALAWLSLLMAGVEAVLEELTVGHVWGDLAAWPLLAAGLLVTALALLPRWPLAVRGAGLSVGGAVLAFVVVCPALDDGTTPATLAVLAALAVALTVLGLVPLRWSVAAALTAGLGTVWAAMQTLVLGGSALDRVTTALASGGPLDGRFPAAEAVGGAQPWLLVPDLGLTVVAVLVARRLLGSTFPVLAGVEVAALAAAAATAALYPVPVWTVVAGLLVAGVLLLVADDLVPATVALAAGTVVATYADGLLAVALATVLLSSAVLHLRDRDGIVAEVAGLVTATSLAASVWVWGDLLDRPGEWVAVVGVVVVALLALVRRSAAVESGAALGVVGLSLAGLSAAPLDQASSWLAVYLTLAGAATCTEALLRPDRRWLGWAGGLLLAAASWVRLADVGVSEPEPYTLPAALALLVVGLVALRRRGGGDTVRLLGPGLGLALVPSLLWVLDDPATLRSLLLGLACLGLVLAGLRLQWTAPLVFGAAVGAAVVLRSAAPYVGDAVPRWATIGAAGVLLVALGITWEQRVREARGLLGYVRQLR